MVAKPAAKANPIRSQILGFLVENREKSLANNVSWLSVDRAAKVWAPSDG